MKKQTEYHIIGEGWHEFLDPNNMDEKTLEWCLIMLSNKNHRNYITIRKMFEKHFPEYLI